ncbi:MAG: hypothetical protein ACTSXG_03080 [Alphaproteobacteria bacterium]
MNGTEKQNKWAESIKQQRKEDLKNLVFKKPDGSEKHRQQKELFLKAVKVLFNQENAGDWISTRLEDTLLMVRKVALKIKTDDVQTLILFCSLLLSEFLV